jgi:hypothetical protein
MAEDYFYDLGINRERFSQSVMIIKSEPSQCAQCFSCVQRYRLNTLLSFELH